MDKYIYDKRNGVWYELQGDYYLPCLKLPEDPEVYIGIWGQRHRRYLKKPPQGAVYFSVHQRQAERLSYRYWPASRENVLTAGKAAFPKRGRDGNAQSGKPNAVGAEDEQSAKRRYGNRIKRACLSLILHKVGHRRQAKAQSVEKLGCILDCNLVSDVFSAEKSKKALQKRT